MSWGRAWGRWQYKPWTPKEQVREQRRTCGGVLERYRREWSITINIKPSAVAVANTPGPPTRVKLDHHSSRQNIRGKTTSARAATDGKKVKTLPIAGCGGWMKFTSRCHEERG